MTGGLRIIPQNVFGRLTLSKKPNSPRRSFTLEFKQGAVDLVVKQGYSFKTAAEAVNVSSRSLRKWHKKLAPQPEPCGDDASVHDLQAEIKRLRKQLRDAEVEREIFKKLRQGKFGKEKVL